MEKTIFLEVTPRYLSYNIRTDDPCPKCKSGILYKSSGVSGIQRCKTCLHIRIDTDVE